MSKQYWAVTFWGQHPKWNPKEPNQGNLRGAPLKVLLSPKLEGQAVIAHMRDNDPAMDALYKANKRGGKLADIERMPLGNRKQDAQEKFDVIEKETNRLMVKWDLAQDTDGLEEKARELCEGMVTDAEEERAKLIDRLTEAAKTPGGLTRDFRWGVPADAIAADYKAGYALSILRPHDGEDRHIINRAACTVAHLTRQSIEARGLEGSQSHWAPAINRVTVTARYELLNGMGKMMGIVLSALQCQQARTELGLGDPPWEPLVPGQISSILHQVYSF